MPRAPTAPAEDKGLPYQPLDAPVEQAKFPHRRKSARRRTPASSTRKRPAFTESQSTCTQYFARTPDTSLTEVSDDGDQMSQSCSDFGDGRPTKKQKTARKSGSGSTAKKKRGGLFDEREPDQQSYTQMLSRGPLHKKPRHLQTDSQGWQLPKFENQDKALTTMSRIRRQQQEREAQKLDVTDWTKDDSVYDTKHSSQSKVQQNSSSQPDQADSDQSRYAPTDVLPPQQTLRTPKNVRFEKIIPSSQSPVSQYQLSTQKSQRIKDIERSPLKERSMNVPSPINSVALFTKGEATVCEDADGGRAKDLRPSKDEVAIAGPRLRRKPGRATTGAQNSLTINSQSKAMPPPPASLRQKDAILDSSFVEGAEEIAMVSPESIQQRLQLADEPSQIIPKEVFMAAVATINRDAGPNPCARQPRQLKRVSTIQDSDGEDVDLDDIEPAEKELETIFRSKPSGIEERMAQQDKQRSGTIEKKAHSPRSEPATPSSGINGSSSHIVCVSPDKHALSSDSFNNTGQQFDMGSDRRVDEDDQDYELPQTYDPVYSALDRDAARCDSTQNRFQQVLRPQVSTTTAETGGEEVVRASQQLLQELSDAMERGPTSQAAEQHEQQAIAKGEERVPSSQHKDADVRALAVQSADSAEAPIEEKRIPSSPPVRRSVGLQASVITEHLAQQQHDDAGKPELGPGEGLDHGVRVNSHGMRISQISTIMPTQMSSCSPRHQAVFTQSVPIGPSSPQRPANQYDNSTRSLQKSNEILPVSSPDKQDNTLELIGMETLPSSPLPLPPWSSPDKALIWKDAVEMQGETLDSVPDFSLPPPPPMSSSSRVGTQRGGFAGSSSPLR